MVLNCLCPVSEHLDMSLGSASDPAFLLVHFLGGDGSASNLCGKARVHSKLLAVLVWPESVTGIWGVRQWMETLCLSLTLSQITQFNTLKYFYSVIWLTVSHASYISWFLKLKSQNPGEPVLWSSIVQYCPSRWSHWLWCWHPVSELRSCCASAPASCWCSRQGSR